MIKFSFQEALTWLLRRTTRVVTTKGRRRT